MSNFVIQIRKDNGDIIASFRTNEYSILYPVEKMKITRVEFKEIAKEKEKPPEYTIGFRAGAKSEKDWQIRLEEILTRTGEGQEEEQYTKGFWAGVKSEKERREVFGGK